MSKLSSISNCRMTELFPGEVELVPESTSLPEVEV